MIDPRRHSWSWAWLWWQSTWGRSTNSSVGQALAPGTDQRDIGLLQFVDAKPDPMGIRKHGDRPPTSDIERIDDGSFR
jgi:hypothetical protein